MNIKNERHIWRTEYTFGRRGMMFYLRIINVTKNDEGLYMCLGYKHGIWANKTLYLKTGLLNCIDINQAVVKSFIHVL